MASKPTAKNTVQVKVSFYDCSVVYQMSNTISGSALIHKACSRLGTFEQWWFGMLAVDTKGISFWVHLDRKVTQQNIRVENEQLHLRFAVKFYPIDFKSEVIQECSKKIFYNHLRDMILNETLYCDAAGCVSLAALHLQYARGDLSNSGEAAALVMNDFAGLIPEGIVTRHDMVREEWVGVILKMWQTQSLLLSHEALNEALKLLQELDMYGVRYYEIRNRKKTPLLLGVEAGGMNIYKPDNRMIPRVSLAWNEIRSISYVDKKFVIKCVEKNAPDFTMYSQHTKENNIIMHICVGNHELYMLRRRPQDPEDVRLLKEKARAAQSVADEEYNREISLRAKKIEYEEAINQAEMAPTEEREQLMDDMQVHYEESMAHLTDKMAKLELQAETARQHAGMSQEEMAQMRLEREEFSRTMEAERQERDQLREAETEARSMAAEAAQEAQRVRMELEELKRAYAEDQKRLRELENAPPVMVVQEVVKKKKKDYKTIKKERTQEANAQVNLVNGMLANKLSTQTDNDKLHVEIVSTGVNKFKTLRSIRNGNTRSRIDEFEAM